MTKQQNTKEDRVLIAVYGTLRKELGNHSIIAKAVYLGNFSSYAGFTMYDIGAFPALVNNGCTSIEFEVYAVNKDEAEAVDRLEGFNGPKSYNHYEKGIISTPYGKAYYYYYKRAPENTAIVLSGDWKDHAGTKMVA